MRSLFALAVAAVALIATASLAAAQYGSYRTFCDANSQEVTFHNYAANDCAGNYTLFSKPLGGCHHELLIFSWNAKCAYPNATSMAYFNYPNRNCGGNSVLTRTYTLFECFNCPNAECKNP